MLDKFKEIVSFLNLPKEIEERAANIFTRKFEMVFREKTKDYKPYLIAAIYLAAKENNLNLDIQSTLNKYHVNGNEFSRLIESN